MVETSGIEPLTSCVQSRRSPSWAKPPKVLNYWMVGLSGLEPPTSRLSGVRSNQLSYRPIKTWMLINIQNWIQYVTSSLIFVEDVPNISLERRWSSRTFRYGYLVTTSPQSFVPPSTASSKWLLYRLRVLQTLVVWRAVCTRPGNVFTVACWSTITSDSSFI